MDIDSLVKRINKGFRWSFVGNLAWKVGAAISMLTIARVLGPEEFGELGLIRATIDLFVTFASMRLGSTLTKYIGELKQSNPSKLSAIVSLVFLFSLTTCILTGAALALSEPILSDGIFETQLLSGVFLIGAVFLILNMVGLVIESALAGFEKFKEIAAINVLKGVTSCAFLIPAAIWSGISGILIGLCAMSAFSLLFYVVYLRRAFAEFGITFSKSIHELKSVTGVLFNFALPGLLTGIFVSATLWGVRVLMAKSDEGFFEVGLFTAANQWRAMLLMLPSILGRAMLPVLAETRAGCEDTYEKLMVSQLVRISSLLIPLTIMAILFSPIAALMVGQEYEGLAEVISLLFLSLYFFSISEILRQFMDAAGKRWEGLLITILWGGVTIVAMLADVTSLSASRVSTILTFSYVFLVAIQYSYIKIYLVKRPIIQPVIVLSFGGIFLSLTHISVTSGVWLVSIAVLFFTSFVLFYWNTVNKRKEFS